MLLLEFILDIAQTFLVARLRSFFGHRMSEIIDVDAAEPVGVLEWGLGVKDFW